MIGTLDFRRTVKGWSPRVIGLFAGVVAVPLVLYIGLLAALVVYQRGMMFFPDGPLGPPSAFGLNDARTLSLTTSDGQKLVTWYKPAVPVKPLLLYFHGNGGTLGVRADLLRRLTTDGSGLLAIDYRGYGGSTGSPSEEGLLLDGEATYAEAIRLGYGADRLVVVGESLGTGVAVALAANHPVKALVLDSPFSSAESIAAARYWMFPVRLLMKDPFDSLARIAKVTAPKLFLHAIGDPVIPIASNRALFQEARQPKTAIEVVDFGHMVLGRSDVMARTKTWLTALPAP